MKNNEYDHQEVEKKWQSMWEGEKIFSPSLENAKNPYYNLMMFPYPSAEGLHVGNMYAFTGADVYARFNRMQGKDVFEPIGLDGFGIHSENYALKIGKNPKEQAKISQENYYRQLRSIGNSFDWQRTVETYDPLFYRWTQWLFIQLFKAGLAYRKKAEVNFCPSCKTVLSDEQVIDGKCERCSSLVEKKELEQWFFKITEYADRLLENIEKLDWTEKVKIAQRNWIGKSEGAVITFKIVDKSAKLQIFTTRPDTLFGATFVVVSPDHPLASGIEDEKVKKYIEILKNGSKDVKDADEKEKTGVFSGLYAVNPVNNEKLPVWISDYVLMSYGTGAIMAVPAHDTRDYAFAKKYDLPIREVVGGGDVSKEAYVGPGKQINSGEWDGWEMPQNITKVIKWLEEKGLGKAQANYHLRDWLISRQRYWGPPIPMIYCKKCASEGKSWFTTDEAKNENESRIKNQELRIENHNFEFLSHDSVSMAGWYTIPVSELPVLLPDVEDWKPMGTGLSPLANHPEFYNVVCPECGGAARRETDVSDTFLDSSWYFLAYISNLDKKENAVPWTAEIEEKWLPVTKYIGGAEHSVLHLLYSRFISMVLFDLKFTHFEEPFSSFFAHGLIIKDGAKMSKSKGNVVVPDEYINKYGADTLRSYLMFLGPFSDGGDFRDSGIEGMNRFLKRVWRLIAESMQHTVVGGENAFTPGLDSIMHRTIKGVTEDIRDFKYNTAISKLMEYYNALQAHYAEHKILDIKYSEVFIKLLAPFAPFMTEELYQRMQAGITNNQIPNSKPLENFKSIHFETWPTFEEKYLVSDELVIVIQVNGKRRGEIKVSQSDLENREKLESQAREIVTKYLESGVKKIIFVRGKIINFVI